MSQQVPPMPPPPPLAPPVRRLARSSSDSMIGGVCGGIARHLNLDPTLVRVLAVVALCFGFPGVFVGYVVAWAIMPKA